MYKVGDTVRVKDSYVKWLGKTADAIHGYPNLIMSREDREDRYGNTEYWDKHLGGYPSVADQLGEYFLNRYSHDRGLDMDGVIVGYNEEMGEDFCYLVWIVNPLGEDLTYIDPENLERV